MRLLLLSACPFQLVAGFGDSDKPQPAALAGPQGHLYNYDTWSTQIHDFINEVTCCTGCTDGRVLLCGSGVCCLGVKHSMMHMSVCINSYIVHLECLGVCLGS